MITYSLGGDLSKYSKCRRDTHKIDKDKFKQVFVKQHIAEFHRRGIKVIAEGIERKEEFDLLKKYGTDFFQGFYLARPA